MTTYYVRTDGNNSNAGTGPGTGQAWATITKALSSSGIVSGDTVYIAPGVYREVVTNSITGNPTAETKVIGDVSASQFSDLQGGPVRWTAYLTNDKTTPSGTTLFQNITKDYMTFENLWMIGGSTGVVYIAQSENITLRRCVLFPGHRSGTASLVFSSLDAVPQNSTIDSCIIWNNLNYIAVSLTTHASADYDANIVFKNCLITGEGGGIAVSASGADSFKGGGVKVYNCTLHNCHFITNHANLATSAGNQCEVYNCILLESFLSANTSGQIIEDYNHITNDTPRTNVTAGSNSIADTLELQYAPLFNFGLDPTHPFYGLKIQSPHLGFGNDGSIGVQTEDMLGVPRPSGPARTWANASKAIGAYEYPNSGQREGAIVRTGDYALKLLGPAIQDIDVPVLAQSTTVSVYGRYDSAYGSGTKPRLRVLAEGEIGVTEQTDTVAGSADTWEQLSVTFSPSRAGIATVRLMSDADGDGAAYFDDLTVA